VIEEEIKRTQDRIASLGLQASEIKALSQIEAQKLRDLEKLLPTPEPPPVR